MTVVWLLYGVKVLAAVATGIGLLACAAAALSSSGTEADRKKMKAPGQNNKIIYRDVFEVDPKTYFRDLHNKN
jgi:predicted RNA methylase